MSIDRERLPFAPYASVPRAARRSGGSYAAVGAVPRCSSRHPSIASTSEFSPSEIRPARCSQSQPA
jgi:hypothetical protein